MIFQIRNFFKKSQKVNLHQAVIFLIIFCALGIVFYSRGQQGSHLILPKISQEKIKGIKQIKDIKDFSISIPKLNISVPVVANVDGYNKEEYFKALENGVAHLQGSKFPGEGGNIIIFGHSSYYSDKSGDYKKIFKNLADLKTGDIVETQFNHQKYLYKVYQKEIVDPESSKFLDQTKKEQLTLITCVPPGTTKYRLIVLARPNVSPK
jgi:LPXTG-site transpeptidase (sortase) family protein